MDDAWLAGLYEGEGTITRAGAHSAMIRIRMIDEDVIRRAHAVACRAAENAASRASARRRRA